MQRLLHLKFSMSYLVRALVRSRHALRKFSPMHSRKTLLVFLIFFCSTASAFELVLEDKALYKTDDRYELATASKKMQSAAQSVGALVNRSSLVGLENNQWRLMMNQTGREQGWCPSERFVDQPTAASCTGFLVAPDQLATSAHCVQPMNDPGAPGLACEDLSIVFGFSISPAGQVNSLFKQESVYHCKHVLAGEDNPTGSDWRVIQLDRQAQNIDTLTVYKGSDVSEQWSLSMVGHPAGLPAKYGDNAKVIDASPQGYFVTDMDAYVGNSGSPVFVESNDEAVVVGLLSRGAEDYIQINQGLNSCLQSRQCGPGECGGEHVTPARVLEEYAINAVDTLSIE